MIIWSVNFKNLTKGLQFLRPSFEYLQHSFAVLGISLVDDKILLTWDRGKLVSLKYGPLPKFSVRYNGFQNRSHQILGHPILYMVLKPPCNSMKSLGHWDSWRPYQINNRTLQWTWCKNFHGQIGHLQLISFIPTNEVVKNVNM